MNEFGHNHRMMARLACDRARTVLGTRRAHVRRHRLVLVGWGLFYLPFSLVTLLVMTGQFFAPDFMSPLLLSLAFMFSGFAIILVAILGPVLIVTGPFYLLNMALGDGIARIRASLFPFRMPPAGGLASLLDELWETGVVSKQTCERNPRGVGFVLYAAPELVETPEGLKPHTPIEIWCPDCGAGPMDQSTPGYSSCGHCGHTAFREFPVESSALSTARRALESALHGARKLDDFPSRAKLRKMSLKIHERLALWLVVFCVPAVVLVGVVIAIIRLMGGQEPYILFFLSTMGGIPVFFLLPYVIYIHSRRYLEFAAGMAGFDEAVCGEILWILAHRGQVGLVELGAHLKMERTALEATIQHMGVRGGAPFYYLPGEERLVSLHASTLGSSTCPNCAADVDVAPNGRLKCDRCDAIFMGKIHTVSRTTPLENRSDLTDR